jgi:hypothetical protein
MTFPDVQEALDGDGTVETDTGGAESSQSGGGGNPTMGSGRASGTDSGQELDETGDGRHELPCGHETFAFEDVPDAKIRRNDGLRMTVATCEECGQSWTVTDE